MATTLEETKEQLLRAVAEVVAESETRIDERMDKLGAEVAGLRTDVHRLDDRIATAERNLRSDLNNMQQTILAAIDKLANPPK